MIYLWDIGGRGLEWGEGKNRGEKSGRGVGNLSFIIIYTRTLTRSYRDISRVGVIGKEVGGVGGKEGRDGIRRGT